MTDPMQFIERTKDQYPGLDIEDVRLAFEEVKAEMHRMDEERQAKTRQKTNPAES
jgi:exonuclease SbcD